MSDWTEGYISDIGYTYGYYSALNPNNLLLPLLAHQIAMPKIKTACELGFGQGVSINAHAAGNDNIEWWGTDFNPAHVSFAQELGNQSKSRLNIFDQTFEEFCSRKDLPDFDFICLHGIWSWISIDNRKILVEFIRNKLKIGGVVYISYNTLPGWSGKSPIRHMLSEHAHMMGSRGQGIVSKVSAATNFTKELIDLSHNLTQNNSSIKSQMERIASQDPHYLAHEYFNRDWDPMYFSDISGYLESAKINYVCSSNYTRDFLPGIFSPEQLQFWESIKDPMFAQSVKDYLLNTQFRTDVWIKGPRTLTPLQIEQQWENLRFVITRKLPETLNIPAERNIVLNQDVYTAIANLLADSQIHSFEEIRDVVPNTSFIDLSRALVLMNSVGMIALAQDTETIKKSTPSTEALNSYIINDSVTSTNIKYLVSPVSGGALDVGRISQLMILAYSKGCLNELSISKFVWQVLQKNNQLLVKDGITLKTEDKNMRRLQELSEEFLKIELPIYQSLRIIK